ncbi:MAG TPA: hypothetical protein VGH90_13565 [Chthoniobacteraceae bacterium]
MNALNLFRLFSSVMALAIAPTLSADPTAPGEYRHWDGDIDQVVIYRAFRADDYQEIHVEPLDITKTAVPDRKGESRPATLALLPSLKPAFMEGLQKNLRRRTPTSGAAGKVLVIRVRLTKADPGTRSPEFGDIQANAAKLAVSGEVIDPATNLILIQFQQERWAGVISIGKTSAQLLEEAARTIGTDVGHLISAF